MLFVLFSILCFSCTVSAQEAEIVNEIWPEVKPIGRTGRLNCTVANKQTHVVQWTRLDSTGNNNEVISQDEKIIVNNDMIGGLYKYEINTRGSENRKTYMLVIRRLREQNAGLYECAVVLSGTANNRWRRKKGSLTVQVAPTIRPGETDTILQLDPGTSANLTCAATGIPYPNITWTKSDGGALPDKSAQSRGAILGLTNVTVSMAGLYRCVADNNIKPPAEHLTEVLIFFAPKSRHVQDSVGQAVGGRYDARLECIVSGYPDASVTWERLDNNAIITITDNDYYEINKQTTDTQNLYATEQWYTLKIKNVDASHFGEYYCNAKNDYGQFRLPFKLFETTECQGPNCPSFAAANSGAGSITSFLTCLSFIPILYKLMST